MKITYWGITGSLASPLLPSETEQKVVACIEAYMRNEAQEKGINRNSLKARIQNFLKAHLPFSNYSTYGGNTTCVEVQTPDALVIFDAGSGAREFALNFERIKAGPVRGHLFLSHLHFDHLVGLPFCAPFFDEKNHFTVWGSPKVLRMFQQFISQKAAWAKALFPPILENLKGIKKLSPIVPGKKVYIGKTVVQAISLNHPGGSQGYRIDSKGKAFVFATDHEMAQCPDQKLAEFSFDADIFYIDSQYSLEEYKGLTGQGDKKGWGHTPVEWAVETAKAANVKALHLGHRDPFNSDEKIVKLEQLGKKSAGTIEVLVPREGFMFHL